MALNVFVQGAETSDRKGRIVLTESVGRGCRHIRVEIESGCCRPDPGQFFLIRERGVFDPLLGRPLAPIASSNNSLDFLFRIVGRGTSHMASLPPGTEVDLRGPCGRGFPGPVKRRLILVSGSLGIAPFLDASARYRDKMEVTVILGVPGNGWEEFAKWCSSRVPGLRITSDDGTLGNRGNAVEEALSVIEPGDEVWGCGPNAMLRELGHLFKIGSGRILVSLESRMACGIGGCLGCSLPTATGMKRVCVDGPVFEWQEIFPNAW